MVVLWDTGHHVSEALDYAQKVFQKKNWWVHPCFENQKELPIRSLIHEVDRANDSIFFLFQEENVELIQSIVDMGYFVVVYVPNVQRWSEKIHLFYLPSVQHVIRHERGMS